MLPVEALTNTQKQEPTVDVMVGGHIIRFFVDTGATFSCIGKDGQSLPLSERKITTQGFSGITQKIPFTIHIKITVGSQTVTEPLMYSPASPVNLLGRDLLSKFNFTISCTPEGLICETPGIDPVAPQTYLNTYESAT